MSTIFLKCPDYRLSVARLIVDRLTQAGHLAQEITRIDDLHYLVMELCGRDLWSVRKQSGGPALDAFKSDRTYATGPRFCASLDPGVRPSAIGG